MLTTVILGRPVECLDQRAELELPIVGNLTVGVVMMDEQREASTWTGPGVAQHWKIAVRISKREQRSATDMEANVTRLRLAIVEAVEFWELLSEYRLSLTSQRSFVLEPMICSRGTP